MGNSLTKLTNDYSFSLRRTSMSPAVKSRHNQEQSERATLANAMAYLSVSGSLLFRHDRCHISRAKYFFSGKTGENHNEMMCFFATQFIKPDTSTAKAVVWIDMNSPRINVSTSNPMKIYDVVETDDEPRSSEKCLTYQDRFMSEMEAMEEKLMKGNAVEVAERFDLIDTTVARPIPVIIDDFDVDRNDDVALPVFDEIELLQNYSAINSPNLTQCITDRDELIPVHYASPLRVPHQDTPKKGFVLPFGPLKEHLLDYLQKMALDLLDKSKPIPYPPPSLLNLENGEFVQLKPPYDISFPVSPPIIENSVARGESDLVAQGHDEETDMTVHKDVCRNIDSPTIHVSPKHSDIQRNVHREPTNPLYQLAFEVRQSLTNEDAEENDKLLINPATDEAILQVDLNNNVIDNQLKELSQSQLIPFAEIPPATPQAIENESDFKSIQNLAMEVREGLERATKTSMQHPLERHPSSNQPNLDNADQELSEENGCSARKPTDEKESHTDFQSHDGTRYSDGKMAELFRLKKMVQGNLLKEMSETSTGSAFMTSSGDSGKHGPAAGCRRSSGDVTCRPGYRGIYISRF